jgi:hypothetical protein
MGRACRSLPSLMTCAHTQELQRTLPGARRISFADESGVKLWARSQYGQCRCLVCAAAHERKSPHGVNRAGLEELHPAINPDGLVAQDLSPIPKQSGKF